MVVLNGKCKKSAAHMNIAQIFIGNVISILISTIGHISLNSLIWTKVVSTCTNINLQLEQLAIYNLVSFLAIIYSLSAQVLHSEWKESRDLNLIIFLNKQYFISANILSLGKLFPCMLTKSYFLAINCISKERRLYRYFKLISPQLLAVDINENTFFVCS